MFCFICRLHNAFSICEYYNDHKNSCRSEKAVFRYYNAQNE